MATGTVEYAAPIAGLQLEPIEISNSHPAVEKIVIETQDGKQLRITFHLADVFALEDAQPIVEGILPSIVNRLAFHQNVPIREPYFTGASLPKDASGTSHRVIADAILLWDSAAPVLTLGEDKCGELARLLEQPHEDHDLYTLYRSSINQSDPVARFMFLYSILLQLHDDKQRQVDDFIREEAPNVPQSSSPKGRVETVFTRLRNEVGHSRVGTTPELTRREIKENVIGLQNLVRKALMRVVSGNFP
jgi:hypothetical protein